MNRLESSSKHVLCIKGNFCARSAKPDGCQGTPNEIHGEIAGAVKEDDWESQSLGERALMIPRPTSREIWQEVARVGFFLM